MGTYNPNDCKSVRLIENENSLMNLGMKIYEEDRAQFTASEKPRLLVDDLLAAELKVISWLAGEKWRLDIFNGDEDIYEAAASKIFNMPVKKISKESPMREKAKFIDLACMYGGNVETLINMGALDIGFEKDELQEIIDTWCAVNSRIVKFWRVVYRAILMCVDEKIPVRFDNGLFFDCRKGNMFIKLPSGRELIYYSAYVKEGIKFDETEIHYSIFGKSGIEKTMCTNGIKFVKDIVKAIAYNSLQEPPVNGKQLVS